MASESGKLEMDVHIKASAEQFYDVFCSRTHHIGNVCPEKVHSIEIHEGEWGTEGSIIFWTYVHGGKTSVAKQRVEDIDRENYKVSFKILEGDLMELYKSFKFILQVVPQEEGSLVRWIIEYEKLQDHIPDPHSLFHLSIEVIKDIDAHLVSQNQK